jgi:hypothetical protein
MSSVLLAGVVAGLALTMSLPGEPFGVRTAIVSSLGLVAALAWFMFVQRNRAVVFVNLARARKIEALHGGELLRNGKRAADNGFLELVSDGNTEEFSIPTPIG